MSTKRFGRAYQAGAILPLALLSAAWTATLTTTPVSAPVSADQLVTDTELPQPVTPLPDGASIPGNAIEAPASVSDSKGLGLGVKKSDTKQIVSTASANGIPDAALSAYQRAETVINSADNKCNVSWQMIAGIGRVESNHGRFGGNVLNDKGVSKPGIYGPQLNGKNNTKAISDTDAGQFDNDKAFDRAVGPMQFIPSTWSVVGVDADGDGQRNPQDIDDAALGTAVYLCSGNDNLATEAGQRAALFRYNNSQSYVNLVLSVTDAYLEGDFTAVPNDSLAAGFFVPQPDAPQPEGQGNGKGKDGDQGKNNGGGDKDDGKDVVAAPAPSATSTPSAGGDKGGKGDKGGDKKPQGNQDGGGKGGPKTPGPDVKTPDVKVPEVPSTSVKPVDKVLSVAQAIVQCTLDGRLDNPLASDDPFDQCIKEYTK